MLHVYVCVSICEHTHIHMHTTKISDIDVET